MSATKKAERGWRCFHCGDTFRSERTAREHFGSDESATPACRIKAGAEGGLLTALRESERALAEAWGTIHGESSEAQRALAHQAARHYQQLTVAEETGYERGLRDGLALTPEERAKMYVEA